MFWTSKVEWEAAHTTCRGPVQFTRNVSPPLEVRLATRTTSPISSFTACTPGFRFCEFTACSRFLIRFSDISLCRLSTAFIIESISFRRCAFTSSKQWDCSTTWSTKELKWLLAVRPVSTVTGFRLTRGFVDHCCKPWNFSSPGCLQDIQGILYGITNSCLAERMQ